MAPESIDAAADLKDWERILEWIVSYCGRHRIGEETCKSILLACEEWFINAVVHGFGGRAEGAGQKPFIRLSFDLSRPGEVMVRLQDNAPPFNPLEHEMPDINLSAADRSIGGLGIYLMLKQAERTEYRRAEGMNELTLWIRMRESNQTGA